MLAYLIITLILVVGVGAATYFFLKNNPKTTNKLENVVDGAVKKVEDVVNKK